MNVVMHIIHTQKKDAKLSLIVDIVDIRPLGHRFHSSSHTVLEWNGAVHMM